MFRALKTSAFCLKSCRLGLCLKFNCFGKFEQILSFVFLGWDKMSVSLKAHTNSTLCEAEGGRLSPSKDRLGAEEPLTFSAFVAQQGWPWGTDGDGRRWG